MSVLVEVTMYDSGVGKDTRGVNALNDDDDYTGQKKTHTHPRVLVCLAQEKKNLDPSLSLHTISELLERKKDIGSGNRKSRGVPGKL